MKKELEQTLVLIKPDGLKNSLTGYILSQISEFHTGLHFAGAKVLQVHEMLASEHYYEHREKPFFSSLLEYIMGNVHYENNPMKRRVIAIVYQGPDAINKIRALAGPTNPHVARDKNPGCIRALGTVVPILNEEGKVIADRLDNLIHASANESDAEREIKLWFKPNEIPPRMRVYETAISDSFYYFKDGKLLLQREENSICILAPEDMAWKTDLEILENVAAGKPAADSLESVVAKYLINEDRIYTD